MTLEEFGHVLAAGGMDLVVLDTKNYKRYKGRMRYEAWIQVPSASVSHNDFNALKVLKHTGYGHTMKAAMKKVKDSWYYEGRKNGNH